ncbi:hypothetical protein SLS57_007990 [Botryosphaeria dothidea]
MDTLSQHHSEYVSLAWGTMKILFILVLNHEEMVSELAKAISKIGDVLPRVRLQLLIFRTAWMQEASQLLYADIIGFLMRCVEWYEASPWRHAWKAFRDPYKLSFNDIVEKIDDRACRMDDMANTLSQKTINEMHEMLSRVEKNINAYHFVCLSHFNGLGKSIQEVQVAQILECTREISWPNPIESLRFCHSVRQRRTRRSDLEYAHLLPKFQQWSDSSSSSLVTIADSAPTRFQTKDLATEMVELMEAAKKPAIWALVGRKPMEVNEGRTINLLKQMTNQVIQLNSKRMVGHVSENFNAPRVESARVESDWLEILREGLTGLSEVYFVIDMETLGYSREVIGSEWQEFFGYLERLVKSTPDIAIKVAVLSFRQDFIRSLSISSPQLSLLHLRNVKD